MNGRSLIGIIIMKNFFVFKFLSTVLTTNLLISNSYAQMQVRAVIDMGSGSTKMKVLNYNSLTNTIDSEKKSCKREAAILVKDNLTDKKQIPRKIAIELKDTLAKFKQVANSEECQATKIVAVGTAVYRDAVNGKEIMQALEISTGVKTYIASWEDEAHIGFAGADAKVGDSGADKCVWDIGGASMQIICKKDMEFIVDLIPIASSSFRDIVLRAQRPFYVSKKKLPKTPNPISKHLNSIKKSKSKITSTFSKLKNGRLLQSLPVYGIGGVHNYGVYQPLGKPIGAYSSNHISKLVTGLIEKSDQEIVSLGLTSIEYAPTQVTNALLIMNVMDIIKIPWVKYVDSGLFDGIALTHKYWN